MSAFDGIKEKAGLRSLQKEVKAQNRAPKPTNYAQARSIGMLYNGATEQLHNQVHGFVRFLKEEEGITNIKAMAYFPEKQTPEYLVAQRDFDFFTKTDVNWQKVPGGSTVEQFVQEPFDILIDLTKGNILPLLHLLVKSKAGFKVGPRQGALAEYYDLMIDLPDGAGMDEFIQQTNHFLRILNQKTA